jgi:integrase
MKIALTSNAMVAGLKLPEGATEEKFFDHGHDDAVPGFGLRVRDSGVRTWFLQYKFGAKHCRLKIGSYPGLTLEKARGKARKYREQVEDGDNPAAKRAETKKRAADTFRPLTERFLAWQSKRLKPRTMEEVERHLLKHARPLHEKHLAGIDRRAVAALLSEAAAERGPIAANRLRASLSMFFGWCMKEGLVEQNAAIGTNRQPETKRDRVLSEAEIREIWSALGDDDYGDIIRLLLLTGARREEVGGLEWREVDFSAGEIVLPPSRTKNKQQHQIPMSDAVAGILKGRRGLIDKEHVFGRNGGFQGWSNCFERLSRRIHAARGKKSKPMPGFVVHDIRRTVATLMGERLGTLPHVIESCLNHISGYRGGISGTYNYAQYATERRQALNMWADYVASIVAGEAPRVVPLRHEVRG